MEEIFMTAEGKKQLEEELENLKVNERPAMAEKIRVAREFGDLSENAEYDIAKDEQAKLEARIAEIEGTLRKVQIIDEKTRTDKVDVGSTVKYLDVERGEEYEYKIVGTRESDPVKKLISNECPVGRALLGKKKGEEAVIKSPSREYKIRVLKIS